MNILQNQYILSSKQSQNQARYIDKKIGVILINNFVFITNNMYEQYKREDQKLYRLKIKQKWVIDIAESPGFFD